MTTHDRSNPGPAAPKRTVPSVLGMIGLIFGVVLFGAFSQEPSSIEASAALRYRIDDAGPYRIVSINEQTITLNGQPVREAQIVTRVRIDPLGRESPPTELVPEGRTGNRFGAFDTEFFLTEAERQIGDAVGIRNRYTSTFYRDQQGEMVIDDRYVMPVARGVPTFLETPVTPGTTWTAPGWEVHDLRGAYAVADLLTFSFDVHYRYDGTTEWRGAEYHQVALEYNIVHREPLRGVLYPTVVTGRSEQTLYWDGRKGRLAGSEETYWIQFTLSDGQSILYEGTASTEVIDAQPLLRSDAIETITDGIERNSLQDVAVEESPEGVTIVLESVGFPPDSSRLMPQEITRLQGIADILAQYPKNDLLVSGHTALAGTEQGRDQLSLRRAKTVGEYLIRQGVRRPEQVLYQGLGARVPRGDNATEEGRRLNRRVEITILDN